MRMASAASTKPSRAPEVPASDEPGSGPAAGRERFSARTARAFEGQGVAGRFLNHPTPHELLQWVISHNFDITATINSIRADHDDQLTGLGVKQLARRTVEFPIGSPRYDVLLVSRHATGVDLWNR
jgi:hypothetical protein